MGQPAAKQGDRIVAVDTHIVIVPGQRADAAAAPLAGSIAGSLSANVRIMGLPAATVGSTADNTPPHIPTPPGTGFQEPPANGGTVQVGSATVRINGKAAARNANKAMTCNDPSDLPAGTIIAAGTVLIG